jgi:glycosyltransferase involved in cell wall biosynthesis
LSSESDFEFQIVSNAVSGHEIPGNVSVQSGIDDDALRAMYQQADVLFLPVTSATANNTVLEGIACGLPVVTTDLASLRCYLPGQEAILIKENDPEHLAAALLKLYHNPELRTEMAEAARRRALDLSWVKVAHEHASVYIDLVARSNSRGRTDEARA